MREPPFCPPKREAGRVMCHGDVFPQSWQQESSRAPVLQSGMQVWGMANPNKGETRQLGTLLSTQLQGTQSTPVAAHQQLSQPQQRGNLHLHELKNLSNKHAGEAIFLMQVIDVKATVKENSLETSSLTGWRGFCPTSIHSSPAKSPSPTNGKPLPPLLISKLVLHCRETRSAQVKHSWGKWTWLHSSSFLPPPNTQRGLCPSTEQKLSLPSGPTRVGRAGQHRDRQKCI